MAQELELAAGNRRPVQLKRVKQTGFTKARRETFLNVLAATCNVGLAICAAGAVKTTVYRARRREPEFAALWQEALAIGYERLEAALMARALGTDGVAPPDFDFADPETILPEDKIDAELGVRLLGLHRAAAQGKARRIRPGRHVATEAETTAALIKKLAVLRRQIEQSGAGAPVLEPESVDSTAFPCEGRVARRSRRQGAAESPSVLGPGLRRGKKSSIAEDRTPAEGEG